MGTAAASLPLLTKAIVVAVLAGFTFSATVAEAKPRKRAQIERSKERSKPRKVAVASTQPSDDAGRWRYGSAAIMVDGNTGKVLYEQDADALRHPASITKVMTLYLLFEQLDSGRLKLNSPLAVSAKAAAQSPSKLGLRPGSAIEAEDAIKAIVTRSANDVAVVIAEAIGGTEAGFAEMMTDKARALGMSRTTYRNASGLPNPGQVTTARDQSMLARAIQDRFPKQYRYFSTRTFYFRGEAIANHNRLLGRVEGVDGIKTGFTNASGFNLVTSVHRDDRFLIGVVLGGRSAGSRDARMRDLIDDALPRAYAGGRTAPKITEVAARDNGAATPFSFAAPLPSAVEREAEAPHEVAPLPKPQQVVLASATAPAAAPAAPARNVHPGSTEPIRPVAVRTVAIQRPVAAAVASSAAASPAVAATGFTTPAGVLGYIGPAGVAMTPEAMAAARAPRDDAPQHVAAKADSSRPDPVQTASVRGGKDTARYVSAAPGGGQPSALAERAALVAAQEPAPHAGPAHASPPAQDRVVRTASIDPAPPVVAPARQPVAQPAPQAAPARSGWIIQIGAFDAEREARSRLDLAQSKAKSVLGNADPYTEKVTKGSAALYRARFAGFDEKGAKAACRLLQRNAFDCMTIKN